MTRFRFSEHLVWPIQGRRTRFEDFVSKVGWFPGRCNVCGKVTQFSVQHDNLRETCVCWECGSINRQRQIASVILHWQNNGLSGNRFFCLQQLANETNLAVYNTEARGAIHDAFEKSNSRYVSSEFLGSTYQSGSFVDRVMHQDLMSLSLATESIDLAISSDVFEHIPDPYKAHEQLYRVLRPAGRHVFTVPFYQTECQDEVRAALDREHQVRYYKEPLFHGDPLREEGALVFTIFGLEMLVKLAKIGFKTNLWKLRNVGNGIIGENGVVFEAHKPT